MLVRRSLVWISSSTQLFSSNQAAEVQGVHLIANWYEWFVVISSHLGDLHEKASKTTPNEDFVSHKRNFGLNERNPFARNRSRTTSCASLRALVSVQCITKLKCLKRSFDVRKWIGLLVWNSLYGKISVDIEVLSRNLRDESRWQQTNDTSCQQGVSLRPPLLGLTKTDEYWTKNGFAHSETCFPL